MAIKLTTSPSHRKFVKISLHRRTIYKRKIKTKYAKRKLSEEYLRRTDLEKEAEFINNLFLIYMYKFTEY